MVAGVHDTNQRLNNLSPTFLLKKPPFLGIKKINNAKYNAFHGKRTIHASTPILTAIFQSKCNHSTLC